MQARIFVSDDGWWMSEAQAREFTHQEAMPKEVLVSKGIEVHPVQEGEEPPVQELRFRRFLPVVIEVLHRDFDEEDVSIEMGRRMRHWEGRE